MSSLVHNSLICPKCHVALNFESEHVSCDCQYYNLEKIDGVFINKESKKTFIQEQATRDKQASSYLEHAKFPTQIATFDRWLNRMSTIHNNSCILDLGCGPGPTTKLLSEKGFSSVSIDFSPSSLYINKENCLAFENNNIFIQDDLNRTQIPEECFDIIVMADFLQHLGSRDNRERLLDSAFHGLKINGHFFLNFFNINIINYIKGDIHGDFSDGQIKYERLHPQNIINNFPDCIEIENIYPTNISYNPSIDRLLSHLPFSQYFSRMMVIEGKKVKSYI